MTSRIELAAPVLKLAVTPDKELLVYQPKRNPAAWPSDSKPSLYNGLTAANATFSLAPLRDGEHAGEHGVHLTYWDPVVRKKERKFLCYFTAADLRRVAFAFTNELVARHKANLRHITKKMLVGEDWCLLRWSELRLVEAAQRFVKKDRKYVVNEELVESFSEDVIESARWTTPMLLDYYRKVYPDSPFQLIRVGPDGDVENAFAYYYDLPDLNGWFLGPIETSTWIRESDFVPKIFGPQLPELVFTIMRELQADCDVPELISRCDRWRAASGT